MLGCAAAATGLPGCVPWRASTCRRFPMGWPFTDERQKTGTPPDEFESTPPVSYPKESLARSIKRMERVDGAGHVVFQLNRC